MKPWLGLASDAWAGAYLGPEGLAEKTDGAVAVGLPATERQR